MYDLEEQQIIEDITTRKAKNILLQLPEGLKKEAQRLSNLIQEKTQATVFVSGEPSWGACDLPIDEAKRLNIDLIVHFGHAPFHSPDIPMLYIETQYQKDLTPLLNTFTKNNTYKTIGLVASVQHIHQLQKIKETLEQKNIKTIIPEGKGRAFHQGQVLGCEYTGPKTIEKDIDAYLVIANGFHALGLLLSTEKPVILINPSTEKIEDLTPQRTKYIQKRFALIEKAKEAQSYGILISTKSGQLNIKLAEQLKQKISKQGKEATIITMEEILPDELTNFDSDIFITTACPRLSIEDLPRFSKPVITTKELLVALGELSWEDNLKTGFIVAPYGAR
jgi:2-(3-amino-3-carboxypropyl)histidine synthase